MIRKCLAFTMIIHLAMVLKQLCPATERLLETQNLLVGFLFLYLKADNFINFAPCNQTLNSLLVCHQQILSIIFVEINSFIYVLNCV
ncbi:hypothetical protein ACB094_11G003900 [Castanea mollissima]